MDEKEYHALQAISASALKELSKSPAHFWAKFINPNRKIFKPTKDMEFGTAVHTLLLEPTLFSQRYAIAPEGVTRSMKPVKDMIEICAERGQSVLTMPEFESAKRMVQSLRAHRTIGKFFSHPDGIPEFSVIFKVRLLRAKSRIDWHIPPCAMFPSGIIVDLKTAADADPDGFSRACWNYRYDIQASFYQRAFMAQYQTKFPPPFVFAATEKEEPFAVGGYLAGELMLQKGNETIERLLDIFEECNAKEHWPAYSDKIETLELPYWATKQ